MGGFYSKRPKKSSCDRNQPFHTHGSSKGHGNTHRVAVNAVLGYGTTYRGSKPVLLSAAGDKVNSLTSTLLLFDAREADNLEHAAFAALALCFSIIKEVTRTSCVIHCANAVFMYAAGRALAAMPR